jgi:CheY-like chemotaxis protein
MTESDKFSASGIPLTVWDSRNDRIGSVLSLPASAGSQCNCTDIEMGVKQFVPIALCYNHYIQPSLVTICQEVAMPTILIVDDDSDTVRINSIILKHEGLEVLVAKDGFQALKLIQSQPPDLILLDLMLPGIDGFEICNRLRANPATADLPVVVITAKTQATDKQMAAKVGANGYLTKPFDRRDLLAAIRRILSITGG